MNHPGPGPEALDTHLPHTDRDLRMVESILRRVPEPKELVVARVSP